MQSRAESKKSGHPNVAYFGVALMMFKNEGKDHKCPIRGIG